MTPTVALMEESWPPAERIPLGPFLLRRGLGGGQRVSAASTLAPSGEADIAAAETAMRAMSQTPLFLLTPQDGALDAALAVRGYALKDPVVVYSAPLDGPGPAATRAEHMTTFPHWPPMAIATSLWSEAGIGAERLAIMHRAAGPRTVILGRTEDRASGVAFVAIAGDCAFLHALHVSTHLRRRGAARNILRAAADWAGQNGAARLCLAVTRANAAARALYVSFGMQVVEEYHYRHLPA